MYKQVSEELLSLIQQSPSCFHAVRTISALLEEAGYTQLNECDSWKLEKGGKYYTTRNGSSVIAFAIGEELDDYHFQLTSSHSDSPTFKVKERAELKGKGGYLQLNTEGYGGMLCATWMDRPLSIAGRVLVREGNALVSKLLSFDRDLVLIPDVAIHMNREVNNGLKYNNQVDMLPLFSAGECEEGDFRRLIAQELGCEENDIFGMDLYLVNRMAPSVWGAKEEFISSPKLDDLQCAFTSLKAMLAGNNAHAVNVYACFDNEEVGSGTKQGALSTFLSDVLSRISENLGYSREDQPSGKDRCGKLHVSEQGRGHQVQRQPEIYDRCHQLGRLQPHLRTGRRTGPAFCEPFGHGRRKHAGQPLFSAGVHAYGGHRPGAACHALFL